MGREFLDTFTNESRDFRLPYRRDQRYGTYSSDVSGAQCGTCMVLDPEYQGTIRRLASPADMEHVGRFASVT